jgi:hypothetical protein
MQAGEMSAHVVMHVLAHEQVETLFHCTAAAVQ